MRVNNSFNSIGSSISATVKLTAQADSVTVERGNVGTININKGGDSTFTFEIRNLYGATNCYVDVVLDGLGAVIQTQFITFGYQGSIDFSNYINRLGNGISGIGFKFRTN